MHKNKNKWRRTYTDSVCPKVVACHMPCKPPASPWALSLLTRLADQKLVTIGMLSVIEYLAGILEGGENSWYLCRPDKKCIIITFFDSRVELGHSNGQSIYAGLQIGASRGHRFSLFEQISKHFLGMPG